MAVLGAGATAKPRTEKALNALHVDLLSVGLPHLSLWQLAPPKGRLTAMLSPGRSARVQPVAAGRALLECALRYRDTPAQSVQGAAVYDHTCVNTFARLAEERTMRSGDGEHEPDDALKRAQSEGPVRREAARKRDEPRKPLSDESPGARKKLSDESAASSHTSSHKKLSDELRAPDSLARAASSKRRSRQVSRDRALCVLLTCARQVRTPPAPPTSPPPSERPSYDDRPAP